MKKNYDCFVTPQNTRQFKLKRMLHILSNACLVVNLIVVAVLLPDVRLWTLVLAGCFAFYTVAKLFDKRKAEWTWGAVILGVVISFGISLGYVLLFRLYGFLLVILFECLISFIIGKYYEK